MRRSRILILSFSPLATDPRVGRQLDLLAPDHEVVAAGFSPPRRTDVTYVALPSRRKGVSHRIGSALRLLTRRYDSYYWRLDSVRAAHAAFANERFDLILANDADTWPLARALAGTSGARLLFDAHEYAPREFEDVWWWRILYQGYKNHLCKAHLPHADGCLTVCQGIADEYQKEFGVLPKVVRNIPNGQLGVSSSAQEGRIRLIHHGLASASRKIEVMIDLMRHLDARFTLDLMLVGPAGDYLNKLRSRAAGDARIRFIPPVPTERIVTTTHNYDLGLFLLPPTNFNYRHALPNKFFEFIHARLAIAIGPSPEMARLVRKHDLGVIADDFTPQALARVLNPLTALQINAWKANAHHAATTLCWEHESQILRREINLLLALGPCVA